MAEPDHLHGLLAVEVVHALGIVDGEGGIGGGVVVVHVTGDVEVHPVHGVDQTLEAVEVHGHIVVDGNADEVGDHVLEPVDALRGVDAVDLGELPVPRDGDHAHLLVLGVIAHHHDGVGVAAALVGGGQQEGVEALLPHQGRGGGEGALVLLGVGVVRPGRLLGHRRGGGRRLLRRLHQGLIGTEKDHDEGGEDHHHPVEAPEEPPQGRAPPLRFLFDQTLCQRASNLSIMSTTISIPV